MKLFHLSDLHLGKRIYEYSLLEDQQYILNQIMEAAQQEKPDAVLIAGDIYDKSVPAIEAVQLLDAFLIGLAEWKIPVIAISGNHDSAQRMAFGAKLMQKEGVYLSPVFDGQIQPITLRDMYGEVEVYPLPFVKPSTVKKFFPESDVTSYDEAIRTVMTHVSLDNRKRNILLCHQFVTGAARCDSEEVSVGGLDNINADVFEAFDYVALGHIHGPQWIGRETIRYCGTPLKYSFSESSHEKSVTVVELKEKGKIDIRTIPLLPLRDMREIKGTYEELTALSFYQGTNVTDYLHVTLTDEEDVFDAIGKLRSIYPNLMKLDYDNKRTRENKSISSAETAEHKTPLQIFSELYLLQNNREMSEEQKAFMITTIERIWEEQG